MSDASNKTSSRRRLRAVPSVATEAGEQPTSAVPHEYAGSEDADAAERYLRRALSAIDDLRVESLSDGGLSDAEAKIVSRLAGALTHARFFIRAFRYDVAHNYERVAANKNGKP